MTLKWLGMFMNQKYNERDSERNVTDFLTSCESAQDKKNNWLSFKPSTRP
jgi:hypothetical protein